MRKFLMIGALLASAALAACSTTGDPALRQQDKAEVLDLGWTLAKASAVTYVATCEAKPAASLCTPGVVYEVKRAIDVAQVAVDEARRQILAAGTDRSALAAGVSYGLSAIAVFQRAILAYGIETS